MAKTCRTCESCYPCYGCSEEGMPVDDIITVHSCPDHKPRETPLLVDELVEALKAMLTLPYRPLRSSPQQASRIDAIEVNAKAAVSRYQEEVGDA